MTISMLNLHHITHNQPFCAGVILFTDNSLVTTLNTDGLPPTLIRKESWRIGGVGGGQEAGETIWDCALREAREELCTEVELRSAPVTYFHDIDTGKISRVTCSDTIAPFLLERQSNLFPYTPYRPGLPGGPYTYFGLFLANIQEGAQIQPGDDVVGLLHVPIQRWPLLQQQPALETMLQQGAHLIEHTRLARDGQLWLPQQESMSVVVTLLAQHIELQQ